VGVAYLAALAYYALTQATAEVEEERVPIA
jgi:hypothetical protein